MKILSLFLLTFPILAFSQEIEKMNKSELREKLAAQLLLVDSLKMQQLEEKKHYEKELLSLRSDLLQLNDEFVKTRKKNELLLNNCDSLKMKLADSLLYYRNQFGLISDFSKWIIDTLGFMSKISILDHNVFSFDSDGSIKKYDIIQSTLSWQNLMFEPIQSKIGNILIISTMARVFNGGLPNFAYGGADENEFISRYYLKVGEGYKPVDMKDCFNEKRQLLLDEINKQALEHIKSLDYTCGEDRLVFPLTFDDLKFYGEEDSFYFEYFPGSNCGGGGYVLFSKDDLARFIR